MCAILDALPLLVDIEDPNEDREAYLSNERLAICVGVSVLGMFECANLEGLQSRLDGLINGGCSERDLERIPIAERNPVYLVRAEMDEVAANIERGIDFRHVFPSPGGGYYAAVAACLCATEVEENYNIPLLALVLYHWERELTQFPILNSVDNYELNGRC